MARQKVSIFYEEESDSRHRYFDGQFLSLANRLARSQGMGLSQFLSKLKDYTSFKSYLQAIFSIDSSLAFYVQNMNDKAKRMFFDRPIIQQIIENNIAKEKAVEPSQVPVEVHQVQKVTRIFYNAETKGKRTRAYEDKVVRQGKSFLVYRNNRGQFAKRK